MNDIFHGQLVMINLTCNKDGTHSAQNCLVDAAVVTNNGGNIFQALTKDFEHVLQEHIVFSGVERVLVIHGSQYEQERVVAGRAVQRIYHT